MPKDTAKVKKSTPEQAEQTGQTEQPIDYELLGVVSVLAQTGLDIALAQAARKQLALDEALIYAAIEQANLDRFLLAMSDVQVSIDILSSVSAVGAYQPPEQEPPEKRAKKTTINAQNTGS